MALDFREIKKTIIDSIKAAVGDDLYQTYNPILDESYGTVFMARPNPELPKPPYPYAVVDITGVKDTDWHLTNLVYDEDQDRFQYETHRTLDIQISIFGDQQNPSSAMNIANKLEVAYRMEGITQILIEGGLGLVRVQPVQILPELLQTDYLEVPFRKMSVRVNDVYIDTDSEAIETIVLDGELEDAIQDELIVTVDTTTP